MATTRVLVCDGDELARRAFGRTAIDHGLDLVGEAQTAVEVLQMLTYLPAEVVVLTNELQGLTGIEVTPELAATGVRVVIVSSDPAALDSAAPGVRGPAICRLRAGRSAQLADHPRTMALRHDRHGADRRVARVDQVIRDRSGDKRRARDRREQGAGRRRHRHAPDPTRAGTKARRRQRPTGRGGGEPGPQDQQRRRARGSPRPGPGGPATRRWAGIDHEARGSPGGHAEVRRRRHWRCRHRGATRQVGDGSGGGASARRRRGEQVSVDSVPTIWGDLVALAAFLTRHLLGGVFRRLLATRRHLAGLAGRAWPLLHPGGTLRGGAAAARRRRIQGRAGRDQPARLVLSPAVASGSYSAIRVPPGAVGDHPTTCGRDHWSAPPTDRASASSVPSAQARLDLTSTVARRCRSSGRSASASNRQGLAAQPGRPADRWISRASGGGAQMHRR